MSFACIGLAGFSHLRSRTSRGLAVAAIVLIAAISFVVSLVGALWGAMYCETEVYAFWPDVLALRNARVEDMSLGVWLVIPLAASLGLLAYSIRNSRRSKIFSTTSQ
jgi:uncharacterized membrane protein